MVKRQSLPPPPPTTTTTSPLMPPPNAEQEEHGIELEVESGKGIVMGREEDLVRDTEIMEDLRQEEHGMKLGVVLRQPEEQLPLPPLKLDESGQGRG